MSEAKIVEVIWEDAYESRTQNQLVPPIFHTFGVLLKETPSRIHILLDYVCWGERINNIRIVSIPKSWIMRIFEVGKIKIPPQILQHNKPRKYPRKIIKIGSLKAKKSKVKPIVG